jgi:hypothetical protein
MPVYIAPHYTQRILFWDEWKTEVENRYGVHQVVTDPNLYTVWFYDYHDVFIVYLHRNGIPDTETALGRTQGDLDAEILDFETNYLPTANASLEKKAANKVAAVAAAKGLGGYLPNPSNNPYMPASDELVSLYVDGEGSLASRGTVLTDEGSFRNDFNADDLATPVTGLASFTSGSQHVYGSGSAFISEISKTGYIRPYTGDDYQNYIEFSGLFGTLQIGDVVGPEDSMIKDGITIAGATGGPDGAFSNIYNTPDFAMRGNDIIGDTGKVTKIVYYTPTFGGGFRFGIAYTPNTNHMGDSKLDNANNNGNTNLPNCCLKLMPKARFRSPNA